MSYYDGISRVERALAQRMYLLHASRVGELEWEFSIEGSRGIPYHVYMNRNKSTCTCPDFMRRRATCKHIMFISARVLRMPSYSSIITQKMDELLTSSLLKSKEATEEAATAALLGDEGTPGKKKLEGACPICFDDFEPDDDNKVNWCPTCKNPIHKACLDIWLRQKHNCPLCRSAWLRPARGAAGDGGDDALAKFDMASLSTTTGASSSSSSATTRTPATSSHGGITQERLPVTTLKKSYGVSDDDLKGLDSLNVVNPRYRNGPPMRLYRVSDVERIAVPRMRKRLADAAREKFEEKATKQAAKLAVQKAKDEEKNAKRKAKDEEKNAKSKAKEEEKNAKRKAKEDEQNAKRKAKEDEKELKQSSTAAKRASQDGSDQHRPEMRVNATEAVENPPGEETTEVRRSKRRRTAI